MLLHQQNINSATRLAVWKIEEPETFFRLNVPLPQHIQHPHKRLQHLAGRYLLPLLFQDFPNEEIEIADTRKPFLPNEQYHFSISHCCDYAAAIVSNAERVGVDVEVLTPRLHNIKQKFLHHAELDFVNAQPANLQLKLLSIMWSAKEAMYKWHGEGGVDFSEMLRVDPFELNGNGLMNGRLCKNNSEQQLVLRYLLLPQITLVWTAL